MSAHRRYTDDEVHAIFERAAVRQEEAKKAEDASRSGLSLEELQEIGVEAGIDPAHIALAASELSVGKPRSPGLPDSAFLGIPTRFGKSRVIRGEVTDEAWEQFVFELREIFGRDGIAGRLGNVREWTVTSSVGKMDRPVKVTVKPDGDDTLVTINQEMKGQAIGFSIGTAVYLVMGVLMLMVNILSTSADPPPIGVGLMFMGMAALFFGGALGGTRFHAKRQLGKFDRALDRIEAICWEMQPPLSSQSTHTPQIDLDALPEPAESESEILRRREQEHQ